MNITLPFSRESFQLYQVYITKFEVTYTESKSWKNNHWNGIWIFIKDKNVFFSTICFVFYRGITLVCLNCDFLADVSGLDNMATHLSLHETHTCQVVIEKGMYILVLLWIFNIYSSIFGQPQYVLFTKSLFSIIIFHMLF